MHILQVTPYYPPAFAYGGIPRIVHGLSNALHKLQQRVSVLTTDVCDANRRVERPIYRNESGVHVWSVPILAIASPSNNNSTYLFLTNHTLMK